MSSITVSQNHSKGHKFGAFILTVLAAGGLVCIVMVILGAFFNVSIMMFRTGSMSPTITAGSIALVREIPATEMHVGDVVTVERGSDVLPVTHRVTQIIDTAPDGLVTFEMRGDANETADPIPYSVSTVKRVFFSIPGAAPIIQWFSNAYVLGGLTIGASALVVWAFWPKKDEEITKDKQNSLVLPAVILAAATTLVPPTANNPDILQLRSYADTESMQNMSPGDSATWIVDAWAETSEPGDVTLWLEAQSSGSGSRNPMNIRVHGCLVEESSLIQEGCIENAKLLLPSQPVLGIINKPDTNIATFNGTDHYRVIITAEMLPTGANASLTFSIMASGIGQQARTTTLPHQPIELPATGISYLGMAGISITLLMLAGAVLSQQAKRKADATAQ